ncbi:MAG: hypothetical protein AB7L71_17070 [Vicinamibacterales bacterium]
MMEGIVVAAERILKHDPAQDPAIPRQDNNILTASTTGRTVTYC